MDDIKTGLLRLEKKMESLKITAICHESLQNSYQLRNALVNGASLSIASVGFIMSSIGTISGGVNLPLAVVTGASLAVKAIQQYCDYSTKAKSHGDCRAVALDLSDDIEYIILKNNHTVESLNRALDVYEERIKSFRKTEAPIPLAVKQRFLPLI